MPSPTTRESASANAAAPSAETGAAGQAAASTHGLPSGAAGPRRSAGPLAPLRAHSRRTAPPLLVYLVAGASGFTSIAETFWVRERLGLSAADQP